MTVLMYDGINSDAATIYRLHPDAAKVAYYINGPYAWPQADIDLFPNADHATISITAKVNAGDVLDVENGDATPGQTAGWIAMRKAAGLYRPTIYCSLDTVPAVRAGTGSYILNKDYDIWVADYNGTPAAPAVPGLPPGTYAAKQYKPEGDEDVSIVYDPGWPHREAPGAAPATLPAPGGLSATAWELIDLAWAPVPGAPANDFLVQLRHADGTIISMPATGTHLRTPMFTPEPVQWRVQVPGGAWSEWGTT